MNRYYTEWSDELLVKLQEKTSVVWWGNDKKPTDSGSVSYEYISFGYFGKTGISAYNRVGFSEMNGCNKLTADEFLAKCKEKCPRKKEFIGYCTSISKELLKILSEETSVKTAYGNDLSVFDKCCGYFIYIDEDGLFRWDINNCMYGEELVSSHEFVEYCKKKWPKIQPKIYFTEMSSRVLDRLANYTSVKTCSGRNPNEMNVYGFLLLDETKNGLTWSSVQDGYEYLTEDGFFEICKRKYPKKYTCIEHSAEEKSVGDIEHMKQFYGMFGDKITSGRIYPASVISKSIEKLMEEGPGVVMTNSIANGLFKVQSVEDKPNGIFFGTPIPFENNDEEDKWKPTTEDYSECCGIWVDDSDSDVIKVLKESGVYDVNEDKKYNIVSLDWWISRKEFDHAMKVYRKIEGIPEQCLVEPDPVKEKERYTFGQAFPLLSGIESYVKDSAEKYEIEYWQKCEIEYWRDMACSAFGIPKEYLRKRT